MLGDDPHVTRDALERSAVQALLKLILGHDHGKDILTHTYTYMSLNYMVHMGEGC